MIADASGDLFGTTSSGTVFEITGSGFVAIPTNHPPTLDQPVLTETVVEGKTLQGLYDQLLANAQDVDAGDPTRLTISSIGRSNTMGFLYFDPTRQLLTYTADGYNGNQPTDSFTYAVSDPSGAMVTGTVDVTITGANLRTQVGTPFADRLTANGPHQRLIGGNGNDRLAGHGTRQLIFDGRGDDTTRVESANSVIYGGPGTNKIELHGSHETVVLQQDGLDHITGFNLHNGDRLDLTQVFAETQIDLGGDFCKLGAYVQVSRSCNAVALSFNPDGLASGPGTVLAVLDGVRANTTLDTLVNDGSLKIS